MQKFFIGVIIFLAIILQISFLPNFFPVGLAPDIILIFMIVWTTKFGFEWALPRTIAAGLALDLLLFYPIGFNIFSFTATSFLINSLSKRFLLPQTVRKIFILAMLILIGSAINYAILIVLAKIFGNSNDLMQGNFFILDRMILLRSICNLIAFAFLYWPLEKLEKIFIQQNSITESKR